MLSLNELATEITTWREEKGFSTPSRLDQEHDVLAKLMLVVTEVSEAAEACRHHDQENFNEEIADTFIRLLDLCGAMGLDIETAIIEKMEVNKGRPRMHGKHA